MRPLLKIPSLDPEILNNYGPVSDLSFLSKITHIQKNKIVLLQLSEHLENNYLFYPHQSAYRSCHNTETALLKLVNGLLTVLDDSHIALMSLLDLSAAFDTIDHETWLSRLHHAFDISDIALFWFRSYLFDLTQVVFVSEMHSSPSVLKFGVPQDSMLGSILCVLYTQSLSDIVHHHTYLIIVSLSDNKQLYKSCRTHFAVTGYHSIHAALYF